MAEPDSKGDALLGNHEVNEDSAAKEKTSEDTQERGAGQAPETAGSAPEEGAATVDAASAPVCGPVCEDDEESSEEVEAEGSGKAKRTRVNLATGDPNRPLIIPQKDLASWIRIYDLEPSVKDVGESEMHGYLCKLSDHWLGEMLGGAIEGAARLFGTKTTRWQERLFHLSGRFLYYWEVDKAGKAPLFKGCIYVWQARVVDAGLEEGKFLIKIKPIVAGRPDEQKDKTAQRIYVLGSEDQDTARRWVAAIKEASGYLPPPDSSRDPLEDNVQMNVRARVEIASTPEKYLPKMLQAVLLGSVRTVRYYLDSLDVDSQRGGSRAIHLAASNGHAAVLEAILEREPQLDVVNEDGETAIFLATKKGHVACVRLLLDAGANPFSVTGSKVYDRAVDVARAAALSLPSLSRPLPLATRDPDASTRLCQRPGVACPSKAATGSKLCLAHRCMCGGDKARFTDGCTSCEFHCKHDGGMCSEELNLNDHGLCETHACRSCHHDKWSLEEFCASCKVGALSVPRRYSVLRPQNLTVEDKLDIKFMVDDVSGSVLVKHATVERLIERLLVWPVDPLFAEEFFLSCSQFATQREIVEIALSMYMPIQTLTSRVAEVFGVWATWFPEHHRPLLLQPPPTGTELPEGDKARGKGEVLLNHLLEEKAAAAAAAAAARAEAEAEVARKARDAEAAERARAAKEAKEAEEARKAEAQEAAQAEAEEEASAAERSGIRKFKTRGSNVVKYQDKESLKELMGQYASGAIHKEQAPEPLSFVQFATGLGFDTASLEKRELERQQVIYEIINTERDYVTDLRYIISEFLTPLRTAHGHLAPEKAVDEMFQNIEEVLPVNEALLDDLLARRGDSATVPRVGDLFSKHFAGDNLKVYEPYLNHFDRAMAVLRDLTSDPVSEFATFADYCKMIPASRSLDLGGWLIKPVQRIMKYPLLCRDLLAKTPVGHPDRESMEAAFERINEVVEEMNEAKRRLEMRARGDEIAPMLVGFAPQGRLFRREGDLRMKSHRSRKVHDRVGLLYEDALALAKVRGKAKKLDTKEIIQLDGVVIVDSEDSPCAFTLIQGPQVYHFECPDVAEKKAWFKELEELIDSLLLEAKERHREEREAVAAAMGLQRTESEKQLLPVDPELQAQLEEEARKAEAEAEARAAAELANAAPAGPRQYTDSELGEAAGALREAGLEVGDRDLEASATPPPRKPYRLCFSGEEAVAAMLQGEPPVAASREAAEELCTRLVKAGELAVAAAGGGSGEEEAEAQATFRADNTLYRFKADVERLRVEAANESQWSRLDVQQQAEQITLVEARLYAAVRPVELAKARKKRGKKSEASSPALDAIEEHYERMTRWVAMEVVRASSTNARAAAIRYFVDLATRLLELQNFASLVWLVAGLEATPVFRLKKTWELVEKTGRSMAFLAAMKEAVTFLGNYKWIKDATATAAPPAVPYLGAYRSELAFAAESQPTLIPADPENNTPTLVNFDKCRAVANTVRHALFFQSYEYPLAEIPAAVAYVREVAPPSLDRLVAISAAAEPDAAAGGELP